MSYAGSAPSEPGPVEKEAISAAGPAFGPSGWMQKSQYLPLHVKAHPEKS
jgi:hypothetical protein